MYFEGFLGNTFKTLNDDYYQGRLHMKEINHHANYSKGIKLFDLLKECCDWYEMPPIDNVTFDNFRWMRKDGDSLWFVAETVDKLYECHSAS